MSGEEREAKTGRCFNDMVVDKRVDSEKGFLYCFTRASVREAEREREKRGGVASVGSRPRSSTSAARPSAASSLLDLAISTGDYVVISTVAGTCYFIPFRLCLKPIDRAHIFFFSFQLVASQQVTSRSRRGS